MDLKRILVIGKNGQLAQALSRVLPKEQTHFFSSLDLDLRESEKIIPVIMNYKPTIVICAAAYTQVDLAEKNKEEAELVNAIAPGEIAKACNQLDIPLIHFSTDYIFDGKSTTPYTESTTPSPLNVYGSTKLQGEQLVQKYCSKYFIFRVTWLYSEEGKNFLNTMLRFAVEREQLKIVNDQIGAPTFVGDLAEAMVQILNVSDPHWGVYHLTNGGSCSWFEFANRIFSLAREHHLLLKIKSVLPIRTEEYPLPAIRPHYSVLSNKAFEKQFSFRLRDWSLALDDCMSRKYTKKS